MTKEETANSKLLTSNFKLSFQSLIFAAQITGLWLQNIPKKLIYTGTN
jgi:hypothetical protein